MNVARVGFSTKIALLIASFDEQLLLLDAMGTAEDFAARLACRTVNSGDGSREQGCAFCCIKDVAPVKSVVWDCAVLRKGPAPADEELDVTTC